MQHYDDVSADDLIAYIESVVGKTPGALTDAAATPLGGEQPFEYSDESPLADVEQVAGRVSEEREDECFAQYELEMELCNVKRAMTGDVRTYFECKKDAFANYQICRGY